MASVNSNGGVVHPILHIHPISRRPTAFLHLAMTGAVVHVGTDGERTALTREEMAVVVSPLPYAVRTGKPAPHVRGRSDKETSS